MAASEIKEKFGTPAALTITLTSLASSTTTVGRQSTVVDNHTTTRFGLIHVLAPIKTGTTSFAAGFGYFYLIKSDGTNRTDGASASDAAFTANSARLLKALPLLASGTIYTADFVIIDPGYEWAIAFSHNTVATLDGTAGGTINWYGDNPEGQ